VKPRGVLASVALSTLLVSAGACFATIDDSKIGSNVDHEDASSDADFADANAFSDATADSGCIPIDALESVTFHGAAASRTEIDLTFTNGPSYKLTRANTGLDGAVAADILGVLPACTSSYVDVGQTGGVGAQPDGGLTPNFRYTYTLIVLFDDGGVNPHFDAGKGMDVQTWGRDGAPSSASDAGQIEVYQ
jgi:hypothetical protein